jgi:hypothetical protein
MRKKPKKPKKPKKSKGKTTMTRAYLLPIVEVNDERGHIRVPGYINDDYDIVVGGLDYRASMMDYGIAGLNAFVVVHNITDLDHQWLIDHSDVYAFPPLDSLDVAIAPQDTLGAFCENIGIPTDWLTPANTYLEFLRQFKGMLVVSKKYGLIVAEETGTLHDLLVDTGGLDTRYLTWDAQVQDWFDATLVALGFNPVVGNPQLRQLMKQASDVWANQSFKHGGIVF